MRVPTLSIGITVLFLYLAVIAGTANADVPRILHYQGMLSDASGEAIHCLNDGLCDDTYGMAFRLYAEADGGDVLFEQVESNVEISHGLFEVTLGDRTPITLDVLAGANLFLGVSINEGPELMPRLRVASSAFALKAQHAVSATTADKASDADTVGGFSPEDFLTPNQVEDLIEDRGFCAGPCFGDSDIANYLSENGYSPGPYYSDSDVESYLNEHNIRQRADAVVELIPVEPGLNCAVGGVQVLSGYDADESGTLEGAEITNAAYVCDGIPGLDGTNGADGALAGLNCQTGETVKQGNDGWECVLDMDGTYAAGDGLVLNGSTFSLNASGCVGGDVLKRTPDGAAWFCASDDVGASEYTASLGVTVVGNDIRLDSSDCNSGQVLRWTGADWSCVDHVTTTYNGTHFALSNQGCPSNAHMVGVDANGLAICEEHIDPSLIPIVSGALSESESATGAFNLTDLAIGATSPNANVTFETTLPEPSRANALNGIQAGTANIVSARFGAGGAADTQINIDLTSRIPHDLVTANATISIDELELGKTGNKSWFNVAILDVDASGVTEQLYISTSAWSASKTVNPNLSFKPKVGHRYVIRIVMSCFGSTPCTDALTTVRVAGRWETGIQNRVTGDCSAPGLAIQAIKEDGTVVCEAGLQRRVVGACNPGSSIRSIDADGSVTCEANDTDGNTLDAGPGLTIVGDTIQIDNAGTVTVGSLNISPRTHWKHVHVAHFQQTESATQSGYELAVNGDYLMTEGDTTFVAPIDLPEGVTVTALHCDLYDNTGFHGIQLNADLRRRSYTSTSWVSVVSLSLATPAQFSSTAIQTDSAVAFHEINNGVNAYSLHASINSSLASQSIRFYGCRIKYTQSSL